MSTKPDDETIATAPDPILRRTAIDDLAKQYKKLCWGLGIILSGLICLFIFSSKPPNVTIFVVLILPLMQLYRCETDLKWLRVIDQIQGEAKPVA